MNEKQIDSFLALLIDIRNELRNIRISLDSIGRGILMK